MKTQILCVFLASLLAFPALAAPKLPPCPVQSYDKDAPPNFDCKSPEEDAIVRPGSHRKSTGLQEGKKAPWTGILMDKGRVIDLGMRVKSLRRLRWLDRKAGRQKFKSELKYREATLGAKLKLKDAQISDLKEQNASKAARIEKLSAWYRSGTFWFAVGIVVASAAFGTAIGVTAK